MIMYFVVISWMFFTLPILYNKIILFSIHISNKNLYLFLCIMHNQRSALPYCYFFTTTVIVPIFLVSKGI